MHQTLLTVKARNVYGFVVLGVCALALGLSWAVDGTGIAVLATSCILLVICCLSLHACFSRAREPFDEMAVAHDGEASSIAHMAMLIALGVVCVYGMVCRQVVDLGSVCCLGIGFGLLARGVVFAWLERGCGADHQDA